MTALEVVIVGLSIVEIVVEPPNATLEPLIVIAPELLIQSRSVLKF